MNSAQPIRLSVISVRAVGGNGTLATQSITSSAAILLNAAANARPEFQDVAFFRRYEPYWHTWRLHGPSLGSTSNRGSGNLRQLFQITFTSLALFDLLLAL